MTTNGQPPEPPDIRRYNENRVKFPLGELEKYAGQHVAFSPDGKRILASGADLSEVDEKLTALGIHPGRVVHDYIDPLE